MKKKRNILTIDLAEKEFAFKSYPEIHQYIGGEAVSTFLLKNSLVSEKVPDPYVSITTGPLSGVFPYTSKAILTVCSNKMHKNFVGGGKISSFLNFSNLDSIQILNKSVVPTFIEIVGRDVNFVPATDLSNIDSLGLSGRRSKIIFKDGHVTADDYFSFGDIKDFNLENNLLGIIYSPVGEFEIPDLYDFEEVRQKILERESELLVVRGSFPSCYGCPMGCALSKNVESLNVSTLPRSLVSCAYAEPVYSDVNLVFSCVSALGLDYNHEFIELFPLRVGELNKELSDILEK